MSRRNWLAVFGVIATFGYFIFVFYVVFSDWSDFRKLKPNEWGDFLSGGLGPIAIFWLILSFFQQSRELQHSVEALQLQAEELRLSVEQQRKMAGIAANQFDLDRAVREDQIALLTSQVLPYFVIEPGGGKSNSNQYNQDLAVKNIGANAARYSIDISGEHISKKTLPLPSLETGNIYQTYLSVIDRHNLNDGYLALIKINSENLRGQVRTQEYELRTAEGIEAPNVQLIACDPPR